MCQARILFIVVVVLAAHASQAQKRFNTQKARVEFTSAAELELIKAASNEVKGILDPATNQFAFTIEVKSFQGFNSALQREHFNEKYMETEKYPKALFTGKIIEQIDYSKNGSYDVRAKGDLDIHGVKQTRIIRGKIVINNGTVQLNTNFVVTLADHNISIPTIVSQKIATQIEVQFETSMALQ